MIHILHVIFIKIRNQSSNCHLLGIKLGLSGQKQAASNPTPWHSCCFWCLKGDVFCGSHSVTSK